MSAIAPRRQARAAAHPAAVRNPSSVRRRRLGAAFGLCVALTTAWAGAAAAGPQSAHHGFDYTVPRLAPGRGEPLAATTVRSAGAVSYAPHGQATSAPAVTAWLHDTGS